MDKDLIYHLKKLETLLMLCGIISMLYKHAQERNIYIVDFT